MENKQILPPSKKKFAAEFSIYFIFAFFCFCYYFFFSVGNYPAKQDLVAIKSKIEKYKVSSSSKRTLLHIDFENGMKIIYMDHKPKFSLVKNLLSRGEEVVFYVDKTGKYKNPSDQLFPMMVECQGQIIVSHEDFLKERIFNSRFALICGVFSLGGAIYRVFIYIRERRKFKESLMGSD